MGIKVGDIIKYVIVFIASMAPISEVRGAIPLARILLPNDSEFMLASIISVIGNLIVAPTVLYALGYLEKAIIKRCGVIGRVYGKALSLARRKSKSVEKCGLLGLAAFVAIPLPATGAWTGSLVAYLLGLSKGKSLLAIEVGVLIASLIVYTSVVLGLEVVKKMFFM
ncbi:MAG: small multi-drug export protein [Sulfolobales archaeon]